MSIITSLYNGASGLTSQSQAIAVVGDNIANVNTVGFKASRSNFQDVLGMSVAGSGAGSQTGLGVRYAGTEQLFNQGSFATTGRNTDLAIDGGGFFVVQGARRGINGDFYTRAGNFDIDAMGYLVSSQGMKVQGYSIDGNNQVSPSTGSLQISGRSLPPRATAGITLSAALDSRAPAPPAFNVLNAAATSTSSTSLPVYDSRGNAHTLQVYFRNTGANNSWEWYGVVDGGELQGGQKGVPQIVARGTMAFTNSGALSQVTTAANAVSFAGASPNQLLSFNFGDDIAGGGTGQKGTTANAQAYSVNRLDQDGYAPGDYSSMSVAGDGTVTATFSNGQKRPIAKLAIASFSAESGLHREGSSLWSATEASGDPLVGTANTGGRGGVASATLEQSNVDLTEQFVQMIALQRGFQANSKTIQVSDENYVTLVQLRR